MSLQLRLVFYPLFLSLSFSLSAAWYQDKQGIMGTNIQVEVWSDDVQLGQQATQAVMVEMERINQLMSPYIASSELSILNENAAQRPVKVSKELFELIALSIELSKETQGAFDITFASVGYLYDYRQQHKPSEEQVSSLLEAINFRHLLLDSQQQTIFYQHPKVKIDLGGIAKGHAVDNAIAILQAMGIQHALVTAGGDTRLLGDRRGKPWMVGIRDPRHADKQAVILPLADIALSTSGDYERYFEQDGQRYHHILSPKSGHSSYEVQSVSIIGPSSTLNDALSTAVFVLGVQQGMDLLNRTPGYDGIIVDNQRKLHYSEDLAQR
ncbi:FAD:protein FMN transferase [Paraglaciecola hydrolytica]|uniref:FAD:protein FMN transferase n=1 Tax=Paraglaciecola hydrolytica TaxID=1799789 RepID=A0A148KLG3_9ALTE|nr:FAD:protein FMN transferase [Paraglaciecola hydrolytica]KXI27164.1 thiamine biosynthesis protein ApbE [Paraglaciecola hydrolytica]